MFSLCDQNIKIYITEQMFFGDMLLLFDEWLAMKRKQKKRARNS